MSDIEAQPFTIELALERLSDDSLEALRRPDLGPFAFTNAIENLRVIRELTQAQTREDNA